MNLKYKIKNIFIFVHLYSITFLKILPNVVFDIKENLIN